MIFGCPVNNIYTYLSRAVCSPVFIKEKLTEILANGTQKRIKKVFNTLLCLEPK